MSERRAPGRNVRYLTVPGGIAPLRLDKYLTSRQELDLTRSKLQSLIRNGNVSVNNSVAVARLIVKGGEKITITVSTEPQSTVRAEDIPIEIVYQDDHLAVVNKPAGMVTHPAAGNRSGTLVNALLHAIDRLSYTGDETRPGIVHRLDKNTSGLLIVAKTDEALVRLQSALREREISRRYFALVWGHLAEQSGRIDLPLGRSRKDRKKMAVTRRKSREAVTEYEVMERFRSWDLLRLKLQTGRTHQIRVHLSYIGHPVFGDPDYGGRDRKVRGMFGPERPLARRLLEILPRQALHAARLDFSHPDSGETLSFESDLPPDFQAVLDILSKESR